MPFVNVKFIEGVFDADQKREIVERLTETRSGSRARTCAR